MEEELLVLRLRGGGGGSEEEDYGFPAVGDGESVDAINEEEEEPIEDQPPAAKKARVDGALDTQEIEGEMEDLPGGLLAEVPLAPDPEAAEDQGLVESRECYLDFAPPFLFYVAIKPKMFGPRVSLDVFMIIVLIAT